MKAIKDCKWEVEIIYDPAAKYIIGKG